MLAREQVLDADLRVDHGSAQALFAAVGPGELAGLVPVAPAGPRRAGPGQPDGADDEERRHEHAEQRGPDLPLQQRDRREHEQRHDRQMERRDRVSAFGQQSLVVGHVLRPDRANPHQQQRGHSGGGEHRVDRNPSLVAPVHVTQVQDQGELVEHQRGAEAEQGRWPCSPGQGLQRRG